MESATSALSPSLRDRTGREMSERKAEVGLTSNRNQMQVLRHRRWQCSSRAGEGESSEYGSNSAQTRTGRERGRDVRAS
jgi:hypothetical protein